MDAKEAKIKTKKAKIQIQKEKEKSRCLFKNKYKSTIDLICSKIDEKINLSIQNGDSDINFDITPFLPNKKILFFIKDYSTKEYMLNIIKEKYEDLGFSAYITFYPYTSATKHCSQTLQINW
jgi:hypothetical protein